MESVNNLSIISIKRIKEFKSIMPSAVGIVNVQTSVKFEGSEESVAG